MDNIIKEYRSEIKRLEHKYNIQSYYAFNKLNGKYLLYSDPEYNYIPLGIKKKWSGMYEMCMKESSLFRFQIFIARILDYFS